MIHDLTTAFVVGYMIDRIFRKLGSDINANYLSRLKKSWALNGKFGVLLNYQIKHKFVKFWLPLSTLIHTPVSNFGHY